MKSKNPFEIAETLDIRVREAREMLRNQPEYMEGWGRPELHPHIISRRHCQAPRWPADDANRIYEHKKLHDDGKVSMCQGRDGEYIIQYAMPNTTPVKREIYFFSGDYY